MIFNNSKDMYFNALRGYDDDIWSTEVNKDGMWGGGGTVNASSIINYLQYNTHCE